MIVPLAVQEAIKSYSPWDGMELAPPTHKETSFIFSWGVRVVSRSDPDASPNWVCLATERCRTRQTYYPLSAGKTSRATRHLKEVHSLQSGSQKRPREANLELFDQQAAETEKNSDKHSLLWDMDGVDGAKSSINVLLDWLVEGTNYSRWREADSSTKETMVKEILGEMMTVNIQHRSPAQIWEKITEFENRFRVAENYVTKVESGDFDEDTLRANVLKYFPYFYHVRHVMTEHPRVRQRRTSDTLAATENSTSAARPGSTSDTQSTTGGSTEDAAVRPRLNDLFSTQEPSRSITEGSSSPARPRFTPSILVATEESAPPLTEDSTSPATSNTLVATEESAPRNIFETEGNRTPILDSDAQSTRCIRHERVVANAPLLEHNSEPFVERAQDRHGTMSIREKELRLQERELQMMEAKNDIDVAIKKVQLECAQREAIVQLLLARKKLTDSEVPAAEIELLLPLPTRARSSQ